MDIHASPIYHVLLIGIDQYPTGYNSLSGCVNDIDAIHQLLLSPPGVGIPPEQICVTRLTAPLVDRRPVGLSSIYSATPTKKNLVQALKELAGSKVKNCDRVLIYYSGHGDQTLWRGSDVWHEALVPHNDEDIEYLFDVEINLLLNAIARRTSDLTVILDCCHSAGATRELSGTSGAIRALRGGPAMAEPPDLEPLQSDQIGAERNAGLQMLQRNDAAYIVVVACQSDEKAGEGSYSTGEMSHGVFTHSLLAVLQRRDPAERAHLRWIDLWADLVAEAAKGNARLHQRTQHPWIIGRSERMVFGGPWEKMDPGYILRMGEDGLYQIRAGRMMGVTEGAEIAVYRSEPLLFAPIGSTEDLPVGRLQVKDAGPSSAVASVLGQDFVLPDGARARLIKPGKSHRLSVSLKETDAELEKHLQESPLLELVPSADGNAEIEVMKLSNGDLAIGNDVESVVATIRAGQIMALRVGLEHYYRYNTVLRMARNCNDPRLGNCLKVTLLDCEEGVLRAMAPEDLADPKLPEVARDKDRAYRCRRDSKFCIKVTNTSQYALNVTLFNCSAKGLVEYLSDTFLRAGSSHVMWYSNSAGVPFIAGVDDGPTSLADDPPYVTDRIVTIGTTRRDVTLHHLEVDKLVQEVVNEAINRGFGRYMRYQKVPIAPAEVWTAAITPVRIEVDA